MPAEYQFIDEWFVPAAVEDVYDVIGEQLAYTTWWGEVFVDVEGDSGPPRPGRRAHVVARGFLPYRLRFDANVVDAERPRMIRMALAGDFGGGGTWTFEELADGTRATLDWRPIVEKPLVKHLTRVLRPLFRANHNWTMVRGQEQIIEHMRGRQQLRADAPPPVEAGRAEFVFGPAGTAALVLGGLALARRSPRAALFAAAAAGLEALPPYRALLRRLGEAISARAQLQPRETRP